MLQRDSGKCKKNDEGGSYITNTKHVTDLQTSGSCPAQKSPRFFPKKNPARLRSPALWFSPGFLCYSPSHPSGRSSLLVLLLPFPRAPSEHQSPRMHPPLKGTHWRPQGFPPSGLLGSVLPGRSLSLSGFQVKCLWLRIQVRSYRNHVIKSLRHGCGGRELKSLEKWIQFLGDKTSSCQVCIPQRGKPTLICA